jgi:hypothetical protein
MLKQHKKGKWVQAGIPRPANIVPVLEKRAGFLNLRTLFPFWK